jgi:hypothetical protein
MRGPTDLHQAAHTVLQELPEGTDLGDLLDALCGMMPWDEWKAREEEATAILKQYL